MSEKLRVFLATSFASDQLNSNGDVDQHGISDLQIAELVTNWLGELSLGRIEVVRTIDPFGGYISSEVRRNICSSDIFLCLFTKRTKDHLKQLWLPSTYVISEASAALMQFSNEQEAHGRLFGIVEEGVDLQQLGMAFHSNVSLPGFRRDRPDGLKGVVHRIVQTILSEAVVPRQDREYLSLDKTVTVWRNGAVIVECRHRFRFTVDQSLVEIPHTMWRVSAPLPVYDSVRRGSRTPQPAFLRCMPITCGRRGQKSCKCRIVGIGASSIPQEHNFDVVFSDAEIVAGEELAYEIAWGYGGAFSDPSKLPVGMPNTVGLRTGDRGTANSVSLTLRFQRSLEEDEPEHDRILDEALKVSTTDISHFPAGRDRQEFWHGPRSWKEVAKLDPCPKQSGAIFEVYRWKADHFRGMAKFEFEPALNYFQGVDPQNSIELQEKLKK